MIRFCTDNDDEDDHKLIKATKWILSPESNPRCQVLLNSLQLNKTGLSEMQQ